VATVPVLCFPYAGAGASAFRRCQEVPSDAVRICPVQLPGREERLGESLETDVAAAVDGVLSELLDLVDGSPQVALFGHSLGAVLAYEAAHRLGELDGPSVVRLFVSGSPGPWTGREVRATGLSDEEFLARVEQLAGYSHPALSHPDLREVLLPTLRADVQMHEKYRPPPGDRVGVPITSIRGTHDDLVSAPEAAQWTEATTVECRLVEVPGGHMYLVDTPAALVGVLEQLS
jgi:surfactin synthase thioesterase subunit